jgi:hypothetical protein
VRDGFRCVVTGRYDYNSAMLSKELYDRVEGDMSYTECAHIFSESTNANIQSPGKVRQRSLLSASIHLLVLLG